MTQKNSVKNTVDKFLVKKAGKKILKGIDKKNLISEGIIDSLDIFTLAAKLEKTLKKKINISDNKIFKKFVKLNSSIDQYKLKNDFEILSVLRNLKIIGIFTRLAVRDKKTRYMKMIPYAWNIIEKRTSKNLIFNYLKLNLNKYFSKKLRLKKWK